MTPEQKLAAILFFESRIRRSDGQAYEDLYCEVMESVFPDFKKVAPHGRIGDRKNDGFDAESGLYCQVYAPHDLHSREKLALKKLNEDFDGLLKHWPHIAPIKEFRFVLNDKYKGTTHPIEDLLAQMSRSSGIACRSFLNKNLENLFESLPEEKMLRIVGSIPKPEDLGMLDFSALNLIIGHLMRIQTTPRRETRPDTLDFHEKIRFNNLSSYPEDLLKVGDYQRASVEEFFSSRGNAIKLEVQQRFIELYKQGQEYFPTDGNGIFCHIFDSTKPTEAAMYDSPVAALMAFFFEKCDIFEPPTV